MVGILGWELPGAELLGQRPFLKEMSNSKRENEPTCFMQEGLPYMIDLCRTAWHREGCMGKPFATASGFFMNTKLL